MSALNADVAPTATSPANAFPDPYSSLNPRRKVGRQLADGIRAANEEATGARIADLLTMVAMPASAADHFPYEFSGGQRQRLAIGRALAARPSALVADEPVSSLDASVQAAIVSLLAQLREHTDLGILLISHDLAVVRQVAQRVAVMCPGEIVETGPIRPVWEDPRHPYTESLIAAAPKADGEGRIPSRSEEKCLTPPSHHQAAVFTPGALLP